MGTYNNYLDGEVDGLSHWDEAQTDRHGEMILHGKTGYSLHGADDFLWALSGGSNTRRG